MTLPAVPYVRNEGPPMPVFPNSLTRFYGDLSPAYGAVRNVVSSSGKRIAAWKLGGTTHSTQALFNVDQLYFGPLYSQELYGHGDRVDLTLAESKVEIELAARISPSCDGADAWCLCAELPSSPIADMPSAGASALVSDRCAAGALVLGPQTNTSYANGLASADALELRVNGTPMATGGLSALTALPHAIVRDFLQLAPTHGFYPQPGQWIATGGLTPCVEVPRDAHIDVLANNKQALSFGLSLKVPS